VIAIAKKYGSWPDCPQVYKKPLASNYRKIEVGTSFGDLARGQLLGELLSIMSKEVFDE
jgi:hypothetical protein